MESNFNLTIYRTQPLKSEVENYMAHVFRTVFTVNSLALCLLVSLCGQALALDLPSTAFPDETEISAQILPLLKDDAYLGIVVGIVGPKERRICGFGALNRHGVEKPNGDTVYPIASITKTFTGALDRKSVV